MTDSDQFCYSWNDEDFNSGMFGSVEDALADALDEADGQTHVYVGVAEPWNNESFYPSSSWVLEHMQEQAWGEAGDCSDGYAEVPTEARDELNEMLTALLDSWCKKHEVAPTFYKVKKTSLYPLPAVSKELVE